MPPSVAPRFALRHRRKWLGTVRHGGRLLACGAALLALTVGPMWLAWWETVVPAAIAAAVCALLVFGTVTMMPLEAIAYVTVYFDRPIADARSPGLGAGRRLYRASGRLDALAREAGLPGLSEFESPDVLDTREPPVWYDPAAALRTVEHLVGRVAAREPLHGDLEALRSALQAARTHGARFYLLVITLAGLTNAHVEARRRGEPA